MGEMRSLPLVHLFVGLAVFGHVTQGEEFIAACPQYCSIHSYSDETGSWVQINKTIVPFQQSMFYPGTFGVENNLILVETSDDSVSVLLAVDSDMTSLLPISGLGTKYIVSACLLPGNYSSVLVIATHSQMTDVCITFKLQGNGNVTYDNNTYSDGDELKVSLGEYQTFTIISDFDLSGTVVNTTQTVALFVGVIFKDHNFVVSYGQLLPVHLYGQEHIVTVPTAEYLYDAYSSDLYQLQIISEHCDNQIVFNNGSVFSMDGNCLYRQYLTPDENFHISSSKPVITLLCRYSGYWYNSFVVVPPLTLYIKHAVIYSGMLKVVTEYPFADIVVQKISVSNIPGEWEEIPGTNYIVGTWTHWDILSVSSNSTFSVLVSNVGSLYNGGYGVSSSQSNTGNLSYSSDFGYSRIYT